MKQSVSVTLEEVLEFIKNNLLELKFKNDTNDISLKETGSKFELSFAIQPKEMFKIVDWMLTDYGYKVKSIKLSENDEFNFEADTEIPNSLKKEVVEDILNYNLLDFFEYRSSSPINKRIFQVLKGIYSKNDLVIDLLKTKKSTLNKFKYFGKKSYEQVIATFKEVGIDTNSYPISGNYKKKK